MSSNFDSLFDHGLYHIIISGPSKHERPYAVHLFTNRKLPPNEAFRIAQELLSKHFPGWEKEYQLRYVGYEEIPFYKVDVDITNMDEIYYVVVKFESEARGVENYVSNVPPEFAEKIMRYRENYVTLDYDRKDMYAKALVHDAINYLRPDMFLSSTPRENIAEDVKVYETYGGYHVRAELFDPRKLDEILRIREELNDDNNRLRIDRAYLKSGLGFLTNALFNEKYWITHNDKFEKSVEKEISPRNLIVGIEYPLPHKHVVDNLETITEKGVIQLKDNKIIFMGYFGYNEARKIIEGVENKLREYEKTLEELSDEELIEKIKEAYGKISPRAKFIVSHCEIKRVNNHVVIRVPDVLQKYIGQLIGSQGRNVKFVENEIGMKVVIEGATIHAPPQKIQQRPNERLKILKRGLQETIRQLVSVG